MADVSVDLKKMKVPELKQALKEKGLPVSGTKAELVKRLGEALGRSVDTSHDGLEDSLQGIDDILNDDAVPVTGTKPSEASAAPASPIKSVPKEETVSSNGVAAKTDASKSAADTTVAGNPATAVKLSDSERLKMRAEKFGVTSTDAKKEQRAQRFGLSASSSDSPKQSTDELERLKKRADRFGTVVSTTLTKQDEAERKRKRAERFGSVSNTPSTNKVTVSAITDLDNEAKKRKRAERFATAT